MGDASPVKAKRSSLKIMLSMRIALCIFVLAFVSAEVEEEPFDYFLSPEVSLIETPQENIIAVAKHLQRISDTRHEYNVNQIAKHAAALVQTRMLVDDDDSVDEEKAKAYAHNFAASKKAITAALNSLNGQLAAGHTHDKNALASAKNAGSNAITSAFNSGSSKCKSYKNKACPLKRAEERADASKAAAKKKMDGVKAGKICPLRTTWGDMDVEKSVPKFGTELRNRWDSVRSEFVKAKSAYDAAVRAHQNAVNAHNSAMASFRTALNIEAAAAHTACLAAHNEYNALKREVASNVQSRKQVWVATLVVTCYVDNLTSNSAAKACADKKRSENTSRWNINGGSLAACKSKATLTSTFGPSGWTPTRANCGEKPAAPKPIYSGGGKGIRYNGMFYRTLDGSDPNGHHNGCENSYRNIPNGCTPVTSNSVCQHMGRHYRWSTHVIVCKHKAYGTVGYNPGKIFRNDAYYLSHSGKRAKTNGCSLRVLLQCK